MGDDELAELRRRKMEELQNQQMGQQAAEQQAMQREQQLEAQIQSILKQAMEPEARERLHTIKLTRPEFARAVEQQIVMLAQSNRLRQKITDEQLKNLLQQLTPSKRDFSITRK